MDVFVTVAVYLLSITLNGFFFKERSFYNVLYILIALSMILYMFAYGINDYFQLLSMSVILASFITACVYSTFFIAECIKANRYKKPETDLEEEVLIYGKRY